MSYDLILRSKRSLNESELELICKGIKIYAEMLGGELLCTRALSLGIGERVGTIVLAGDPWQSEREETDPLISAIQKFDLSLHDPQTGDSINNLS